MMMRDKNRKSLGGPLIVGAIGLPLLIAALMGWALALNTTGTFTDLKARLAAAESEVARTKADLSKTSEALTAARAAIQEIPEAVRNRAELRKQVGSLRAELEHLEAGIGKGTAALDKLRGEARHLEDLLSETSPSYLTTGWARLRAGPNTEATEIAVVGAGVPLRVFEAVGDGAWYKVGRLGYMHRTLLEREISTETQ